MGGGVYGGYAESELGSTSADSNTATVTDSIIESGGVYGGYANTFGESTSATADNNTVTVSGSAVEEDGVYGGFAFAYGESNSATADNNTVTVSGNSTTNVNVYGGYADAEDASSSATANNNTVNIIDSDIQGSVYGAGTSFLSTYTPSLSAFNNTVTLAGATNVEGDVFGAYNNYAGGNLDTGRNTLNIRRPKAGGITVGGDLGNFEYLNFYLPEYFTAGGIMLKVAGDADIDGSEVYLGFEGSRTLLKAGDTVTLLSARNQLASPASTRVQGQSGATLRYDFNIYTQGNELLATVASMSLMEQTKALSEGFLGGMGLMIMGADTLADQGIAGAVDAAKAGAAREGFGLAGFGTVSGGRIRYNTGSHVDVSGFSLLAGLSLGQDLTPGRLTLGAFFEYGLGDYNTYNSFSNAASAHGGGDTSYVGGGILGHFAFIDTGPGHFYAEAAARMGRVESEFSSSDLRDSNGRKADYDSESLYYGLHFGAGYVWNITDAASLDLYGKYFWTRQEGDSVKLSTGEPVHFDAVDSHRIRAGGRFAYAVNEYFSPYVGAAYEHEFDGKARATTNGFRIDAPTLEGSTGIGEVGLSFRPTASIPLSIDLGVQGYTGQREGVTGSLYLKLEF